MFTLCERVRSVTAEIIDGGFKIVEGLRVFFTASFYVGTTSIQMKECFRVGVSAGVCTTKG